MENTYAPENNVANSFNRVKADIIRLQDEFMQIRETQVRILDKISRLESVKNESPQVIRVVEPAKEVVKKTKPKKRVVKSMKANYLASKTGNKFHDPGCNALKNVSRENLVSYPTKNKAISKGLQPCGMCIPR